MGSSCSAAAQPLRVKIRYTIVYSPLCNDCLEALSQWVKLASKFNKYANFTAINVLDKNCPRSLSILPATNPRNLPIIFVHTELGKPPVAVPFNQIRAIEDDLLKIAFLDEPMKHTPTA
jgi:hypothetical protein